MTRSDLLTKLVRRTNKNTTLDTATKNRLIDFLNERQLRILSMPGTAHLRDVTLTFDSVQSQADYTFPNLSKIKRITDTTNDRVLYEMTESDMRFADPQQQEGTPEAFVWRGRRAVAQQPSNASSLFVDSTSASDTGTAYIEGVITGGYPRSASVSMTGTTAVNISSAISTWIRVDKFYLSAAAVGTVTLHEDSDGGTELARITIGQTSTDYFGISLWKTPSESSIAYLVDGVRHAPTLAQDTDVPLLPEDFHDLLLLGALMDEYQHMNDPRYDVVAREYLQRERAFKYWLAETATGQMGPFEKPSRLGAWTASGV